METDPTATSGTVESQETDHTSIFRVNISKYIFRLGEGRVKSGIFFIGERGGEKVFYSLPPGL